MAYLQCQPAEGIKASTMNTMTKDSTKETNILNNDDDYDAMPTFLFVTIVADDDYG